MVTMNDSTRRLIMMLTIILAGTAVTFMELSPIVVFIISLVIGMVMLFGLKILSFDELKEDLSGFKERLNQPITLKKTEKETGDTEKAQKSPEDSKTKESAGEKKREIPFSGLIEKLPFKRSEKTADKENLQKEKPAEKPSLFSGIFAGLKRGDKKEDKSKKIDELLDKTINEPIVESGREDEISTDGEMEIEEDDFSELDGLELGLEDEDFESDDGEIEPGAEQKTGSPAGFASSGGEEEIPDSAIAEILAKEGIDFDLDSDDEFPESAGEVEEPGDETGKTDSLSDIDELDDDISGLDLEDEELDELDQIDLDEIEPDEEIDIEEDEEEIEIGDSEEESQDVVVAPPEESDDLFAAPPKEWSQTKPGIGAEDVSGEESMSLSFGGGGDDDDLFAMLKADTKKAVTVQELSLVRDLKDTKVESRELVEGLETVLHELGVRVEKIEEDETQTQNE